MEHVGRVKKARESDTHAVLDDPANTFGLVGSRLHHELVMDHVHQARLGIAQPFLEHRQRLEHHLGGASLTRRIDRLRLLQPAFSLRKSRRLPPGVATMPLRRDVLAIRCCQHRSAG